MSQISGVGSPALVTPERLRADRHSRRLRDAVVIAVLACGVIVLAALVLVWGTKFTPLDQVIAALRGESIPGVSFSVSSIRAPRALGAVLVGAAFGLGGIIFQTLLRNVLASPDVIGISSGASAAAVVSIAFFAASGTTVMAAAVFGALATALLIWAVASKRGLSGMRFVLAGVAVAAGLQAVIAYALTRTDVNQAHEAVVWMTGSLSRSLWDQLRPIAPILFALLVIALIAARRIPLLALSVDTARALGVREQRDRLLLIVLAVLLISVATSLSGPIAFVAFLSGPIATRLVRRPESRPFASALVGALIVLLADAVSQHAFPAAMPIGVITGAIGAPFLIVLLMRGRTRV
ncbi:FecCD family ABC transporter permease [Leucobacter japonicus]|uniref:FecCD family ABC transporter permease n=1 Tax=Leucobacter japonicus TaxID=1461259 RepID=UPI0006A7DB9C|nr:iron chelate uptake ABC transporter family permease subunit [Leucobacter japonicus]